MTKKEIAYNLMVKYLEAEDVYFEEMDKYKEERKNNPNMDNQERTWWRGQVAIKREITDTFNQSRKALGITDSQWSKAYNDVCINRYSSSNKNA